jgi:hypothetical protein
MLRIPHSLDSQLTDGGKVVSLTHRPLSTPQKMFILFLVLISVRVNARAPKSLVRLERFGKLGKKIQMTSSGLEPVPFRIIS